MRGRAIIPLVVGLGIGVFAIKLFIGVLQNARGSNTSDMVEVATAVADIPGTMEISDAMVTMKPVPKALAPKMGFMSKEEVVNRVASLMIPNGSAITANMLAPKGTPAGLAARIPEGFRAVAVKIDEYAGVAGWLKPQARVDVVAMMVTNANGKRQTICRTILQDVEVLTVGQNINDADPAAAVTKSVTLAVRPSDVPKLHLAASENGSKLRLAMRGQQDRSLYGEETTTDNDLLNGTFAGQVGARNPYDPNQKDSFINRLLSNPSKNSEDATDKVTSASVPDGTPVTSAVPLGNEWVVELINGNRVEHVCFEGNDIGARRVNAKSRYARPMARPSGMPVSPAPPQPPAEPAAEPEAPAADSDADPTPVEMLE